MDPEIETPGILVPLDGSPLAEQALPYAQALLAPGAALILLAVVEESEPITGRWDSPLTALDSMRSVREQQAHDDLRRAEATLRGEQPLARLQVTSGDPADQIVHAAAAQHVELIAMTTHGRGAIGRWLFGSVADRVARSATVPVLLVRPSPDAARPATVSRLVVPLDGSALAEQALPAAQALATRLGIPLHLITALDLMRLIPVSFGPLVAFDAGIYQETLAHLESGATAMLAEVSERIARAGVRSSSQIVHGSPFAAIADALQVGDLIVMTSHGRGGVRRWSVGSVAEKLVREAPAPVILVPVSTP